MWCTPHTVLRYFRARKWDYAKTRAMIRATIKWREEMRPESITWDAYVPQMETVKCMVGLTTGCPHGRPIMLMDTRRDTTECKKDLRASIKHLVYFMEVVARHSDRGPMDTEGKIVWFVNQTDYKSANAPPLRISLEVLGILQNHYPERLGLAIMYNAGVAMNLFWSLVKPFIDPVTKTKIQFIKGPGGKGGFGGKKEGLTREHMMRVRDHRDG